MTPPPSRPPAPNRRTQPSTPCPKLPRKPKRANIDTPPVRKVIPFHRLKRRRSTGPTLNLALLIAPLATLIVGTTPETRIDTPLPLLCAASPFFACALQGAFKESATKTVRLPDDDPKVVEAFVAWLDSGRLGGSRAAPPADAPRRWIDLARLWIFGDRVRARRLQDDAMEVFLSRMHEDGSGGRPLLIDLADKAQVDAVDEVYENTVPKSPLRQVILDSFMWQKGDKELPCNVWLPREFRHAVAMRMKKKPDSDPEKRQFVNSVSGYLMGVSSEEAEKVLQKHKRRWRKQQEELRIAVDGLKLTE